MSGIIVGVDGSAHSRKALEYAAKEAVAHHTSLTVLTVHQAVRDVYGSPSHYSDDASLTDKARQAAQAERPRRGRHTVRSNGLEFLRSGRCRYPCRYSTRGGRQWRRSS